MVFICFWYTSFLLYDSIVGPQSVSASEMKNKLNIEKTTQDNSGDLGVCGMGREGEGFFDLDSLSGDIRDGELRCVVLVKQEIKAPIT